MMYWINKIVWFWGSPTAVCWLGLLAGHFLVRRWSKKIAKWMMRLCVVGLIIVSLPISNYLLFLGIESRYQRKEAKEAPTGDVIVALGGSWKRSWYAAEMQKANKAPKMIVTGVGIIREDVPLIYNLGVDRDRVIVDNEARNTEENIKNARLLYKSKIDAEKENPKVLLVTTAIHVPRSALLMKKYWPEAEVVVCPTEFFAKGQRITWRSFLPSVEAVVYFNSAFHEYIGYFGYKWFRK